MAIGTLRHQRTSLQIYDIIGRLVSTLTLLTASPKPLSNPAPLNPKPQNTGTEAESLKTVGLFPPSFSCFGLGCMIYGLGVLGFGVSATWKMDVHALD